MATSVDKMIKGSLNVSEYTNPVAYDENHDLSYGYWICKICKASFYVGSGRDPHKPNCSVKEKTLLSRRNENMIYVLGVKENGFCAPFNKKEIEKIKATAKSHMERLSGITKSKL